MRHAWRPGKRCAHLSAVRQDNLQGLRRRSRLFGALAGIDASLWESDGDPMENEPQPARGETGELTMDNELPREKMRKPGPLAKGSLRP
jgi:hypothetical protein